ncbi:hypothetical protein VPH35_066846 [Triticum aestivum]
MRLTGSFCSAILGWCIQSNCIVLLIIPINLRLSTSPAAFGRYFYIVTHLYSSRIGSCALPSRGLCTVCVFFVDHGLYCFCCLSYTLLVVISCKGMYYLYRTSCVINHVKHFIL